MSSDEGNSADASLNQDVSSANDSQQYGFDDALNAFEKARAEAPEADETTDDTLSDEDKETLEDDSDEKGDDSKEGEADKTDDKPEDEKKAEDEKKEDKPEEKKEESTDETRAGKFKQLKADSEALANLNKEYEQIGGIEGLKQAAEFVSIINDPERTADFIAEINKLPHAQELRTEIFFTAFDNPETREIAFNDMLTNDFGLPENLQFSQEEMTKIGEYIAARASEDKEDFFDEIDGEIQRYQRTNPQAQKSAAEIENESLRAEINKLKNGEKTDDDKKPENTSETNPNNFAEELGRGMDAFVADYTGLVTNTFQAEGKKVFSEFRLDPAQITSPEIKGAAEELQRILEKAYVADLSGTKLFEAVRENLPFLTGKDKTINPSRTAVKNQLNNATYSMVKNSLKKLSPLLSGKLPATVEDTETESAEAELIASGERRNSLEAGGKPKIDYSKISDPLSAKLGEIEGKR